MGGGVDNHGITRADWEAYIDIQCSGTINMADIRGVESLTGLSRATLLTIMQNYQDIANHFAEDGIDQEDEDDERDTEDYWNDEGVHY